MLRVLRSSGPRQVVLALYALAAALLGLAHHTMAPAQDRSLSAYALPDGTLPVLCGPKGQTPPRLMAGFCEACCLTAAPGLVADTSPASLAFPQSTAIRWMAALDAPVPATTGPALRARAPPAA